MYKFETHDVLAHFFTKLFKLLYVMVVHLLCTSTYFEL